MAKLPQSKEVDARNSNEKNDKTSVNLSHLQQIYYLSYQSQRSLSTVGETEIGHQIISRLDFE